MGIDKVEAMRVKLAGATDALQAVTAAGDELNKQQIKINASDEQRRNEAFKVGESIKSLAADLDKVDTSGVPEFEHYKQTLLQISDFNSIRMKPMPIKPMQVALARMKAGNDPALAVRVRALDQLTAAADKLNAGLAKEDVENRRHSAVLDKYGSALQWLKREAEAIDTTNLPEFEQYKAALVAAVDGRGRAKPLPTKPLQIAVARMKKQFDAEFARLLDKHAANLPKELAAGMVIGNILNGDVFEIVKCPKPSKLAEDAGDFEPNFEVVVLRGKTGRKEKTRVAKVDLLRKGMRLIRT